MKKLLLLAFLGLATASCSKDDPAPAPAATASFTASRQVVEISEEVTFTNASTGAARYEWEFGDGQTSTQASPAIRYAATGTYTVTLKSYNSDNQPTTQTLVVTVGRRRIGSLRILAMNFLTPTGQPWDSDGTGPDPFVTFDGINRTGGSVTPVTGLFSIKYDVTASSLPLIWNDYVTFPIEPPANGNFAFVVQEFGLTMNSRQMLAGSLSTAAPSADRDSNGSGTYTYQSPDGLWRLVFYYTTTP